MLHQLIEGPKQLLAHQLVNLGTETVINLRSVFDVVYFMEKSIPKNISGRQCLYVPREETFKAWDFILHLPAKDDDSETFIFIQVSKSSLRQHDLVKGKYRIKESMIGSSFSMLVRIDGFDRVFRPFLCGEIDRGHQRCFDRQCDHIHLFG